MNLSRRSAQVLGLPIYKNISRNGSLSKVKFWNSRYTGFFYTSGVSTHHRKNLPMWLWLWKPRSLKKIWLWLWLSFNASDATWAPPPSTFATTSGGLYAELIRIRFGDAIVSMCLLDFMEWERQDHDGGSKQTTAWWDLRQAVLMITLSSADGNCESQARIATARCLVHGGSYFL